MRGVLASLCVLLGASSARADIKLPATGILAGPLDDVESLMGDEITNYPFGKGVGTVPVHGWISIEFGRPASGVSKFRLTWRAVGDVPLFAFASGHFLTVRAEANFDSAVQLSRGDLDLATGEIRNLELHAVLENVLIQKSSRYNRLPILSKGDGFSALFVDFPPPDYPFAIPYRDRPTRVFQEAKFVLDASQQIRGFEFRGTSFIPITLFPKLGLMPPYAFARNGVTLIPGVDGCLPGTTPENECLSEARLPGGISSPDNAFLGPSLYLISRELREVPPTRTIPASQPGTGTSGATAASLGGRVHVIGGFDGRQTVARASVYDPTRNEWSALPDAPRTPFQACAVASGARVYLVGGRESIGGPPVSSVHTLDPASRTWTPTTALPIAVAQAACAEVDGRIYVLGGLSPQADGSSTVSDQAWSLEGTTWRPVSRMPAGIAGAAVAVVRGEIYVVNGTRDGKSASNGVWVYTPATGAWRAGPATLRGVYGASATLLEGRLFVAGGRVAVDGALDTGTVLYQSQTMQVLVGDKWYAGLYPPLAVAESASALVGDTWYLVGGDISPSRPAVATGAVQAFQAPTGWTVSNTAPVFTSATVRNAASLGVGPAELSPGSLASVLGFHLSAATLRAPAARYTGRYFTTDLPEVLGDVRVTLDGVVAGIVAVSPDRIDFQVPFGVAPGRAASLQVTRGGSAAPAVQVPIAEAAPGLFVYDYGETLAFDVLDEAAAITNNANGRLNYPSQPAARGEVITLVCTGLGEVEPRLEPLQRAGRDRVSVAVRTPEVLIDGKTASVESARLIPGEAGLYEVRVRVPLDARTGVRVPVQLRSGQISSNRAVIVIE